MSWLLEVWIALAPASMLILTLNLCMLKSGYAKLLILDHPYIKMESLMDWISFFTNWLLIINVLSVIALLWSGAVTFA